MKFFMLFFLSLSLFADVKEELIKTEIKVGDSTTLIITYQNGDVKEWNLPSKGFIFPPNDDKIPFAEINEIEQDANSIKIHITFIQSGEYKIPVVWTLSDGENISSQSIVKVTSNLKDEKGLIDIADPLDFSGPYLLRLLLVVLIVLSVSGLVFFIVRYIINKRKLVMDAIIKTPLLEIDRDKHKRELLALFNQDIIIHKDFIFALSGFIKESIGNHLEISVFYMTEEELYSILNRTYKIPQDEIKKINLYFTSIKYMPNDEIIQKKQALDMVKIWERTLKVL